MLSAIMLKVVMLNVANNPFMLSVVMLSVIMVNVFMLTVVVPVQIPPLNLTFRHDHDKVLLTVEKVRSRIKYISVSPFIRNQERKRNKTFFNRH